MVLERLAMIIKDIGDIHIFYSQNERVKQQLNNLLPYKNVSVQPCIKRDSSIACDKEMNEEEFTEKKY